MVAERKTEQIKVARLEHRETPESVSKIYDGPKQDELFVNSNFIGFDPSEFENLDKPEILKRDDKGRIITSKFPPMVI